ncbi:hypothetical protein Pst134EA_001074 [Puccinia striiformis f. sp. tritici]|uniref:hypothetical protein n=1 Tax=Puccinia striiformis f. sp. tritici TaxID=168172 RepID=UPI0020074B87|nr:hypothetical protein Pst134EA_001074 [Puccinia striiformis f. sp. tritici]KAH9474021.1 hypothetical protein Pst134EA_001074 [Puccinia striiformis f. sp. tritici]
MWNENSLIWSGLAKVVEPNAQEPTDFRHRYDLSHGCLSPGDGYSRICDPSAGASHGDRNGSRPANEGLGFSHSHQDSNDVDVVDPSRPSRSDDVWGSLPRGVVLVEGKPIHHLRRPFKNSNRNGVRAIDEDKKINLHLTVNKESRPKSITLENKSQTHSVIYTLHDVKSGRYAWERSLDPGSKEVIILYAEQGEVEVYVQAGSELAERQNN